MCIGDPMAHRCVFCFIRPTYYAGNESKRQESPDFDGFALLESANADMEGKIYYKWRLTHQE